MSRLTTFTALPDPAPAAPPRFRAVAKLAVARGGAGYLALALLLTGCDQKPSYSWTVACLADGYEISVVQLDRRTVAVTCTRVRKESP